MLYVVFKAKAKKLKKELYKPSFLKQKNIVV